MNVRTDKIPDVEILVALQPEELGLILLKLAKQEPRLLQRQQVLGWLGPGYDRHREVSIAVAEAWAWLEINMLLVPDEGINGDNGYRVISRRGKKLETTADIETFKAAASFPKSLLHPTIAEKVWLQLVRGDFDEAVFASFKAVEVAVRDAAQLADTDIGIKLMRLAFDSERGPLTNLEHPVAEREALANLFVGAIGSYKNPRSHRTVSLHDPGEAQEMVVLASHLLRIVDGRRPKT